MLKTKRQTSKKKSSAFTLIEVMLAISITMLIILMVYSAYSVAMRDVKVRQTAQLIDMIFDTSNNMTMTRTDFMIEATPTSTRPISIAEIVNMRNTVDDFPSGTGVDFNSGIVSHTFGGEVQLTTASSVTGAFDLAALTLYDVPGNACLRLLSSMAPVVYDMSVNGSLVGLFPEPDDTDELGRNQLRVEQAVGLCQRNNDIEFRVLKEINFATLRHRLFPFGPSMTPEESAFITPLYDRQQNAIALREAAQQAL